MRMRLMLTPEELVEVNAKIQDIVEPYRQRERGDSAPPESRTVLMHYSAFPDESHKPS
jgi:hypothetical protein